MNSTYIMGAMDLPMTKRFKNLLELVLEFVSDEELDRIRMMVDDEVAYRREWRQKNEP